MKTINLNLNYSLPENEKLTSQQLTIDYLLSCVNTKHKEGLEGQLRRIFGRVQRKCDEALDKKYDVLELEDSEFDLIKDCFEDAKFPAVLSKYVNILEEEVERSSKA